MAVNLTCIGPICVMRTVADAVRKGETMATRAFLLGTSVLILVTVPVCHAVAEQTGACRGDAEMMAFWSVGLAGLDLYPPELTLQENGQVVFRGHQGWMRHALLATPVSVPVGLVLHITDEESPGPVSAEDAWAHCVFAWRAGVADGPEDVLDTRQHPLYRAVLDACRLVELLTILPDLRGRPLGLVGESYGATIALGVAALMRHSVSFAVAHQPICVSTAVRVQAERQNAELTLPAKGREALMHFSPVRFAPLVEVPVLMTVGLEDDCATPLTVIQAYEKLRGERTLLALSGTGHCPAQTVTGWEQTWRRWATSVVRAAPGRPGDAGADACGSVASSPLAPATPADGGKPPAM